MILQGTTVVKTVEAKRLMPKCWRLVLGGSGMKGSHVKCIACEHLKVSSKCGDLLVITLGLHSAFVFTRHAIVWVLVEECMCCSLDMALLMTG